MRSMRVQIFLSCSFDPVDSDVVDFFASICRGLDIHCVNVDKGCASTPPDKARELIGDSHALMAIATRRAEGKPGIFTMPKAIDEEMSMAYANEKPILLFAENGVDTTSGFIRNYCTYQEFDRGSLMSPEFLEKAVKSIHGIKMEVISPQELQLEQQGQEHVFAESIRFLIELVDQSDSYIWRYSQTRRLRFTSRFTDPIKAGAWADVQTKIDTPSDGMKWSYTIQDGTKSFSFKPTVEKNTHNFCEVSFDVDPKPEANDYIQYSTVFESPYLNPVYLEDVQETHPSVTINGIRYLCSDGVIPIVRTQDMKIQLRFPAKLGLKIQDFVPFVASYTNKADYLVESEMKRMNVVTDSFGGNVFIELTIQSPLLQHLYGVAWNPPKKQ